MRTPYCAVFLLCISAACSKQAPVDPLAVPLGLADARLVVPADDPLTAAKAALGKQLFFDPRLSGSGSMSCATCHPPERGWADGQRFSKKDDGTLNTRNTPSMYNVGYLDKLYWDGRAATLEKNVVAAWKAQMGGKPEEVAKKLAAIPDYQKQFEQAMGGPPGEETIARALAAFLRTVRSGDSPFDRWQAGKSDAIPADAQRGYELFLGKAGCNICHQAPLFTDRTFHNAGIGMAAEKPDVGAGGEKALNDPKLLGAFKTPGLRGVAKTAPYFHDGSVANLKDAVKLMASGGLPHANKDPLLADRGLSDAEIGQLVAFLESLTSTERFEAPVLPK